MVGMNPTDEKGAILPLRASAARQAAGVTEYEREWDELQQRMDERGFKQTTQLRVPIRNPDALPRIAEILAGLANEITALHNATDLSPYSKLFELSAKCNIAERRLKDLKA